MESSILPSDLPNIELNEYSYEQGFDEKLLVNSEFAECFSCPIYQGIPRSPVIINLCGHLFSECCIVKQFEAAKLEAEEEGDVIQCAVANATFKSHECYHSNNSIRQ